ncbi:hypothetical protein R5R35_000795 [Gryllus longicercus]|uniref:Accessory gland protein n=1 Tax=Gryllus longicercus TaxID=2509291 RepID=A0AAN9VSW4_9ORTH
MKLWLLLGLVVAAVAQHRGPPLAPPPSHPGPLPGPLSGPLPGPIALSGGPAGPVGPGPAPLSGPGGQGGPGGPKEGSFFTNEAIRQAQNSYLIPKDATIQKVQEGMEVAAYESIPGDQRINLFEILGAHVPPEVVNNLQAQVDQVGRQ